MLDPASYASIGSINQSWQFKSTPENYRASRQVQVDGFVDKERSHMQRPFEDQQQLAIYVQPVSFDKGRQGCIGKRRFHRVKKDHSPIRKVAVPMSRHGFRQYENVPAARIGIR